MNILFAAHKVPFPPNNGTKIRSFHQVKYLSQIGHNVVVAAPAEGHELSYLQDLLREGTCQEILTGTRGSLIIRALNYVVAWFRGEPFSVAHYFSSSLRERLKSKLSSTDFDVIFCSCSSMAVYFLELCRLSDQVRRPKLIIDFVDVDSDKWVQLAENSSWWRRLIYRREAELVKALELEAHDFFDLSVFISEADRNLFATICGSSDGIEVIPNGLDLEFFSPRGKKEHPGSTILFCGVMDYAPNVDAVIWFVEEIFPRIRLRHPNCKFIIAGMNPSRKVSKLAKREGVHVTGYVENIRDWYHRADVVVTPIRMARGVQNKVLEALACGLPVVSTTLACEGIAVEDRNDILIADDVNKFSNAVIELLSDRDLAKRVGSSARAVAERHYDWSRVLRPMDRALLD